MIESQDQYGESGLIVERYLPPQHFLKLGAYIQTCAHIELQARCAIRKMEGILQGSPEWLRRGEELSKNSISELITELGKAAQNIDEGNLWKERLRETSGWLHRYKDNRHLAVHGAHFAEGDGIVVRSERKMSRGPQVLTVANEDIAEMIFDANRILAMLIDFNEQ